jgi:4Fe-4S ferredoxin
MTISSERPRRPRQGAFDAARIKRLARDLRRPGEQCDAPAGRYRPVVDRRRCEGKADCVSVCPYGVFEVGRIAEQEFRQMPSIVRLKLWVHGKKTAYTPGADDCRACGLCVIACPEKAITLAPPSGVE